VQARASRFGRQAAIEGKTEEQSVNEFVSKKSKQQKKAQKLFEAVMKVWKWGSVLCLVHLGVEFYVQLLFLTNSARVTGGWYKQHCCVPIQAVHSTGAQDARSMENRNFAKVRHQVEGH
jgi:hypothetical protein